MKKEENVNWCVLVKINLKGKDEYFLEMIRSEEDRKKWEVLGFKSEQQGMDYYQKGYDKKHLGSYESSMSACVHFLFFHPSIIRVAEGIKGLQKLVGKNPGLKNYSHISGFYTGIPIDEKIAVTLWDRGRKPSLFDQDRFNKAHEEKEVEKRLLRGEY